MAIAITFGDQSSTWRPEEDRGRFLPYQAAIRDAGAELVMVGLECADEIRADPRAFLKRFDGLILSGGGDVHPALWPCPPHFPGRTWEEVIAAHHMSVNEERDRMEVALARAAIECGLPTLGICRGHQVIQIALGGQLILDLDPQLGHRSRPDRSSSHHRILLEEDTPIRRMLGGQSELMVNSRHHQGVARDQVAPPLRLAALAEDGLVVEAFYAPSHPWLVGIQWHPERSEDAESHRVSRPLFHHFVAACHKASHG